MTIVPQRDASRAYIDVPTIAVSASGRYVAFVSYAPLVPADVNRGRDVYVLDRVTGAVTLESVAADGRPANGDSGHPGISGDGRYLVYQSTLGAPPGQSAVLLRDRHAGTVMTVGAAPAWSYAPVISANGHVVAFVSAGAPVVPGGDANGGTEDVYAMIVATRAIERISVDVAGRQPTQGDSFAPAIDADGRFIAFASTSPLDPSVELPRTVVRNGPRVSQIFVRDRARGTTRLLTRGSAGRAADGPCSRPAIDGAGRHVAFVSTAANLTRHDEGRNADVLVVDLETGAIELISRSARGGAGNGPSAGPVLSGDGRFVAFQSEASDLVCARRCRGTAEDINLLWDVLLFDRRARVMTRVSGGATDGWLEPSVGPAIDRSAEVVAFSSRHPIDASDVKNDFDLFIRAGGR